MRALIIFCVLVSAAAMAQDFVAPGAKRRPIVSEPVEIRPSIEGIIKEIFDKKKPWQAVNPLAPSKYGSGEKMVSKDFGPSTANHSQTLTLIGIHW